MTNGEINAFVLGALVGATIMFVVIAILIRIDRRS